jgi:cell division protein FtsL
MPMNATARALAAGTFNSVNLRHMLFSGKSLLIALWLCSLLVTAFAVIYSKDMVRQETAQLHSLQYKHDQMMIEQSKLLLEQNTWSSPIRIQSIAQNQLNMTLPAKNTIVFVG